jgi:hypothetical protein
MIKGRTRIGALMLAIAFCAAAIHAQAVTSRTVVRMGSTSDMGQGFAGTQPPPAIAEMMGEAMKNAPGRGRFSSQAISTLSSTSPVQQVYRLDAAVYSVAPGGGLSGVQPGSAGTVAGILGQLRLPFADGTRRFEVKLEVDGSKRLTVRAEVRPVGNDQTEPKDLELDLSDMKATAVEIARDPDGKAYLLNLTPGIQKVAPDEPKPLTSDAAKLHHMVFNDSPVILDGTELLGLLSGGGFEYAFVEVPGMMRVEFALVPMPDAQPIGTLKNGKVRIVANDGRTFEVLNVASELSNEVLPGGPYTIYAKWLPPTQTAEEAQAGFNILLSDPKFSVVAGSMPPQLKEMLDRLASGKPAMTSHGGGGLPTQRPQQ